MLAGASERKSCICRKAEEYDSRDFRVVSLTPLPPPLFFLQVGEPPMYSVGMSRLRGSGVTWGGNRKGEKVEGKWKRRLRDTETK